MKWWWSKIRNIKLNWVKVKNYYALTLASCRTTRSLALFYYVCITYISISGEPILPPSSSFGPNYFS
jgi:hypothetical protein